MPDDVRNIAAALAQIHESWQPHRLTTVNDYDVKVVKLEGEPQGTVNTGDAGGSRTTVLRELT